MRREEWLIRLDQLVKEDVQINKQEHATRELIHEIWTRHYPSCGLCGKEDSVRLSMYNEGPIVVECYACGAKTPMCDSVINATYIWDAMVEAQETINALKDPTVREKA